MADDARSTPNIVSRVAHMFDDVLGPPDWLRRLSPRVIQADLFAGLTGATIVLPQAVAFAAIAGLPPEYGFYTAMITPIIAALFGSSWHAVSGPTTAISVLVFGTLAGKFIPGSPEFIAAAISLALLVGLFQFVLGMARLGGLVDFVSHSVMTGFITGAALLIGLSQIRHALGLELPRPEDLIGFGGAFFQQLPNTDPQSLLIAVSAVVVGLGVRYWLPSWPNYLIALAAATGVSLLIANENSQFATVGSIQSVLPIPIMPDISIGVLRDLGSAAFAIAIVGLLEAMSISRALAQRSGQDISSNREFAGQGVSNIVGSFFQCYPGSASFTRSAVNYDAGAQTPLSAIFAALFLFLILLLVAPWFSLVPIPAMAGVIILVAWRLIDVREIRHIVTTSGTETWIALVTFATALFVDLEFSIYTGVLLSLGLFLNGTSKPHIGIGAPDPNSPNRMFKQAESNGLTECPQLLITRLDGPLYFGSVEFIRRQFRRLEVQRPNQKHMIFIVKGIGEIDMPAADLLIEESLRRHRRGGSFHLQTKTPRTISKLARYKVMPHITKKHVHLSKGVAIAEAVPLLDRSICDSCKARVFLECPPPPAPEPEQQADQQSATEKADA